MATFFIRFCSKLVILDKKVFPIAQISLVGISVIFFCFDLFWVQFMSFKCWVDMSWVIILKIFCFWTCNFWQCSTFILLVWNNIFSSITLILFNFFYLSSALIFVWFIKLVKDVFVFISSNFFSSIPFCFIRWKKIRTLSPLCNDFHFNEL